MTANGVRLRQAVLVARELEPVATRLRGELGLAEPFRDPGVAEFGLANVVFAVGDCFLEVVSPVREQTAAGRQLERAGGDGGYMVLFDLEDLEGARRRAAELGVRTVWRLDLPDISGTHMHPSDLRGAIVSLDQSRPYGSWRWGGPGWTGAAAASTAPARLLGVTVAVADPDEAAARWGGVLGREPRERVLSLDGGEVRFREVAGGRAEGLVEIELALPAARRAGRDELVVGAARLLLRDLEPAEA
jgi:Glyoxalase-like domain